MRARLDPLGILRARENSWATHRHGESVLVLGGQPARYWRLGPSSVDFLRVLADLAAGLTVHQALAEHPAVDVGRLVEASIVHYVPPEGLPLPPALVAELWRRNLGARAELFRREWTAVGELMRHPSIHPNQLLCRRPLILDQIEAAARLSFGLPGTSRKCTVVARVTCMALRARGYPARVVVLGSTDQRFMHARTVVEEEAVDPSDELLEGDCFAALWP